MIDKQPTQVDQSSLGTFLVRSVGGLLAVLALMTVNIWWPVVEKIMVARNWVSENVR